MDAEDESLAGVQIAPGKDVTFRYASSAEEGQLAALFHMRQQTYYVGFYYELTDHDGECELIELRYGNSEYAADRFEQHEVTVIGVHPFLRR